MFGKKETQSFFCVTFLLEQEFFFLDTTTMTTKTRVSWNHQPGLRSVVDKERERETECVCAISHKAPLLH